MALKCEKLLPARYRNYEVSYLSATNPPAALLTILNHSLFLEKCFNYITASDYSDANLLVFSE